MSPRATDPDFSLVFRRSKNRAFELPAPPAPICDTHVHLTSFGDRAGTLLGRMALAGERAAVTLWDPLDGQVPPAEEFLASLGTWATDARAFLDRAREAGVEPPAFPDVPASGPGLPERLRFLAGAHPYGAADYGPEAEQQVERMLDDPRCAGVGEVGIDYHADPDDGYEPIAPAVQMSCLAAQLDVARRRGVPVELHLRNAAGDEGRAAHRDALRVLDADGVPPAGCVLHCFGEDRAVMEEFLARGCLIAFGGAATFRRNAEVRDAFMHCPADRLLFETDAPYMAPEPLRGRTCEPAMIAFTADRLVRERAEVAGENRAALYAAAWENSLRLFWPDVAS